MSVLTIFTLLQIASLKPLKFSGSRAANLFIDEAHKYPGWAREVKNLYDFYKDLNLVLTGSSILKMVGVEVDLSRGARVYGMNGLSFREFLAYNMDVFHDVIRLEDIVKDHVAIASGLNSIKPLKAFREYLNFGYYPFLKEDAESYFLQLSHLVNLTIGYDLAFIQGIDKQQTRKRYKSWLYWHRRYLSNLILGIWRIPWRWEGLPLSNFFITWKKRN